MRHLTVLRCQIISYRLHFTKIIHLSQKETSTTNMIFAKFQLKGNYFCCNFVTMERIAFLVTMGPITECTINFQYYFSALDLSTEYHCIWANMLCLLLGWLTKTAHRSLKFPPLWFIDFWFSLSKRGGAWQQQLCPSFLLWESTLFWPCG